MQAYLLQITEDSERIKSQGPSVSPKLRLYIYVDEVLWYKSEIFSQTNNPILDLKLTMNLPLDVHDIRLDVYNCANLTEEEERDIQVQY